MSKPENFIGMWLAKVLWNCINYLKINTTELEVIIDAVAERIGKLGGKTIGTMNEFSKLSRIIEHPNKYPVQRNQCLQNLLADHEILIAELRKDIDKSADENHDAGTADLLTGILQQHETIAWILRRYLA